MRNYVFLNLLVCKVVVVEKRVEEVEGGRLLPLALGERMFVVVLKHSSK